MKLLETIEDIYHSIIPWEYRPEQLWYQFKCWAWYRYSTVKSRHLSHTWVDRDTLLHYTMFEILCDFIEKENHGSLNPEEQDSPTKEAYMELERLYKWWNEVYIPFTKDQEDEPRDPPEMLYHPTEDGHNRVEFKYRDEEHKLRETKRIHDRWALEEKMNKELIENMKSLCENHWAMWT